MCFGNKRMLKILEAEASYRNEKIKQLEAEIKKMDEQFQKWKEEVLSFEYGEYSSSNDSCDDDWLCNGECVRTDEDEDAVQRPVDEDDGGTQVSSELPDQEGGQ